MAVKASAETIREMKKQIAQTIKDIERINQGIKSGIPGNRFLGRC